jgi:hypothetical protein
MVTAIARAGPHNRAARFLTSLARARSFLLWARTGRGRRAIRARIARRVRVSISLRHSTFLHPHPRVTIVTKQTATIAPLCPLPQPSGRGAEMGNHSAVSAQVCPVEPSRFPPSVGWPKRLSPITLTTAGLPDLNARSSAGTMSSGFSTYSPWHPISAKILS